MYFVDGDYVNSALSAGSAIPVIGNAIAGIKVVNKGMGNLRVLKDVTIKGYRVSMDLERGGSGLTNIHVKIDNVKYYFNKDAGAFLNEAGDRLPNSLRGNSLITKALEKALDIESKGW